MKISLRSHLAKMWIVHIQEDLVRCPSEVIIEFALCSLHSLKTSESEKMSLTDVCDKSIVR